MINIMYTNTEIKERQSRLPLMEISSRFMRNNRIKDTKVNVKIGTWVRTFEIQKNEELTEKTITIQKGSLPFEIPTDLLYEMKYEHNTLHIGPVIAFIAVKKNKNLTLKVLEKNKNRFEDYSEIGGLLFVCAGEAVDFSKDTIEGYYYNPIATDAVTRWKKGEFPFPDSIFKKLTLPLEKESRLQAILGNKVFNTNRFSKLDLWRAFSTSPKLNKYLPYTSRYDSKEDLQWMLQDFETVYIKPVSGSKGIGIFMIMKEGNTIIVNNYKKEKQSFHSLSEVDQYLRSMIKGNAYLIQQGIPTTYKNKHVDFRFYFQKDYSHRWICQGSIGRVGQEGSIITNLQQIAHLTEGLRAIKIVFHVKENEAKRILNEAIEVCMKLCEELHGKLGHYGDIALDVIIDQHYKPWILEVNNGYGTKSLEAIQNTDLLKRLKTTPFQYAKSLAGF
ncbi:hypothetical protein FZW96_15160 [Bacillus sp. BGMRC 2118]|nr:hypothetical protein FZW96_15160 [Bacillus sp. BGMRC 2118]